MMVLKVKVYDDCKYNANSKKVSEAIYNDVEKFEVKTISDEEMYAQGFDVVDKFGEYAILTFTNGETATFRNSYVDVFKLQEVNMNW